jgi:hypothetical protein
MITKENLKNEKGLLIRKRDSSVDAGMILYLQAQIDLIVHLLDRYKTRRIDGYAVLFDRPDSQFDIFTKDAVIKAWEEFKKHGDHTVYLNFDKTKPVGRLLIDACQIDEVGLKMAAMLDNEKAKGFGISGRVQKQKFSGSVRKVEKFELYGVSATEKPFPENVFEE